MPVGNILNYYAYFRRFRRILCIFLEMLWNSWIKVILPDVFICKGYSQHYYCSKVNRLPAG